MTACNAEPKSLSAYFKGTLDSTLARKSVTISQYSRTEHKTSRLTFSSVRLIERLGQVEKILHLITKWRLC